MSAENLTEIKKFIKWAKPQLGIEIPIQVKLVPIKKSVNGQGSFGSFNPTTNQIIVAYEGRHIIDVLRTLGHEMVHLHQNLLNKLTDGSGKTGSNVENEANALAGVLMRNWNKQNIS
jgi:hypothetical protein